MTLLEIIITPIHEKRVELNQSMDSLQDKLQQCCLNLEIVKTKNTISLIAELENEEQLKKMMSENDFIILRGAIITLGMKYEVLINGVKRNGQDLSLKNLN